MSIKTPILAFICICVITLAGKIVFDIYQVLFLLEDILTILKKIK